MRLPRFRDAPLLWKILVPFLVLLLAVGTVGSFAIVRGLTSRAQADIDQELTRRATEARSRLHERELVLLESVGFAANLQGMAEAVEERDATAVGSLLRSVQALKPDLDVLVAVDGAGREAIGGASDWTRHETVMRALASSDGRAVSGLDDVGGLQMLLVAAPICAGAPCRTVGAAVAGFDLGVIAREIADLADRPRGGVVVHDAGGRRLAAAGATSSRTRVPSGDAVRIREALSVGDANTLFSTFRLGDETAGSLAVTVPTDPFFSSVRGTAWRLAALLLVAMGGIVAVGVVLARRITAQVRPLVATNRALGRGDLGARAPVLSSDELGELAQGLNDMAGQLQASHETLELRVRQRTDEVRRLLRERTELFASVSHEFRTPLAVILGQLNMLRDPKWRKENLSRAIDTLDEASRQLSELIEVVLAAARAESAQLDVQLRAIDLPEVVGGVSRTLEGLVRSGDHALAIDVPADLPPVRADPARLREVLLNLVDNSVKYTPPGGLVEVSAAERNGHVEVSVRDTGPGIPKRMARRLFEPFKRVPGTKTQRGQPSTGLGLAFTKRLVEAHGGKIWVNSGSATGTTVTFTLQRATDPTTGTSN